MKLNLFLGWAQVGTELLDCESIFFCCCFEYRVHDSEEKCLLTKIILASDKMFLKNNALYKKYEVYDMIKMCSCVWKYVAQKYQLKLFAKYLVYILLSIPDL